MSLISAVPEPVKDPWCLAFTNTVSWRAGQNRADTLVTYQDLRSWLLSKGVLSESASSLEDAKVLERAKRLREAIYGIAAALSSGRIPESDDVDELNWHLQSSIVSARLEASSDRLTWDIRSLSSTVSGSLGLIAISAAALFTSGLASRVRQCKKTECGWLFLDLSKNRSRKWCDMSDCGNVEKARRYYAKVKAARHQ